MSKKSNKNLLFERMNKVAGMPLKEYDNYNYPAGADADPSAPWNQQDADTVSDWGIDDNLMITFESSEGGVHKVDLDIITGENNNALDWLTNNMNHPEFDNKLTPFVDKWIADNENSIEWEYMNEDIATDIDAANKDSQGGKYYILLDNSAIGLLRDEKYNLVHISNTSDSEEHVYLYFNGEEYRLVIQSRNKSYSANIGEPEFNILKDKFAVENSTGNGLNEDNGNNEIDGLVSSLLNAYDGPLDKFSVISRAMNELTDDSNKASLYANALEIALDNLQQQGGRMDSTEFPNFDA